MNLDIHSAIAMVVIISILGALFSILSGLRLIRKSRKVAYFRIRRKQVAAGWKALFVALLLIGFAFLLGKFGEPVSYRYFPPSPSPTLSPTITLTPTLSLTPTISLTPSITPTLAISYTPTVTSTPFLPITILARFDSLVTPYPSAIFSPLVFSLTASDYHAINPQTVFQNPLSRVLVTYTYDGMENGVQWTGIWYLNGQMLNYETGAWEGGTGGSGIFAIPAEQWLPGIYQVVFFVGTEWKVLGEFRVMGDPPTSTPSPTLSLTRTPTMTPSLTNTRVTTSTPLPTDTLGPTRTPTK